MPMGIGICAKAPKNPETNMASYMWIILMVSGAIIHFAQANSSLEHTSLGQFISAIRGLLIIGGAIVMPIWYVSGRVTNIATMKTADKSYSYGHFIPQ